MGHPLNALKRLGRLLLPDGGNVALLFALMMPVIVGGAGLGVETAYWRYAQLKLQAAADAAAFAGAVEKRGGASDDRVTTIASGAAADNGFTPGSIVVKASLASGANASNQVEVDLQTQATRFFTSYFNSQPVALKARAVASYTPSSEACILALDPSAADAAQVTGSGILTLQGCSVMSNSLSNQALSVQGSGRLTAPCVISAGGVSLTANATLTECAGPITQAPRASDPYADLPVPPTTGPCADDSSASLSPGIYCSGLSLSGTVSLAPGVYVIKGGDLNFGSHANITGSGVTFYLVGSSRLSMNSNGHETISAPTTGTYAGMLMFGDRTNVGGQTNKLNGDATTSLTGAFYFAKQELDYLGNFSGQGGCVKVVAGIIKWSGNSTVKADCTSLGLKTVAALTAVKLTE